MKFVRFYDNVGDVLEFPCPNRASRQRAESKMKNLIPDARVEVHDTSIVKNGHVCNAVVSKCGTPGCGCVRVVYNKPN